MADRFDEHSPARLTIEPERPRQRKPTPTVERIVPPRRPAWRETGEFRLADLHEDSGAYEVDSPSAEVEIAPLVKAARSRPRTPLEQRLRLATAALLVLLALVFFGQALADATARALTGKPADRWREVPVTITSSPSDARVYVEDRPRGRTPFRGKERCLGRIVRVRVELPGHDIWQWSGLCEARGLLLQARLSSPSP